MSEVAKRTSRTKILAGGLRARVARHGETETQQKAWQDQILKRGHRSIVFPTQDIFDMFLAKSKAHDRYKALVDRVMVQYFAGELVLKAKSSKAATI